MKYIARTSDGQEIQLQFGLDIEQAFAKPGANNTGWLIDAVGVIVSIAHLVALVPVVESVPDEPANVKPRRIIDNGGDIWRLCPNGYYSLKPDNASAEWTAEMIEDTYGIRKSY